MRRVGGGLGPYPSPELPLNKWLLATYLISSSIKGMSVHQLGRTLGVTYKTAWFMAHSIRDARDVALGIDDTTRTEEALRGIGGKRLTHGRIGEAAYA